MTHRRIATLGALAAALVFGMGCGDDDSSSSDAGTGPSDSGTTTIDSSTTTNDSGTTTSDAGSGSDFTVPSTVQMAMSIGAPSRSAALCQNFVFGGTIGFSLQQSGFSSCPGGAAYVSFVQRTDLDTNPYQVFAGEFIPSVDSASDDYTAVDIMSTTTGTLTQGTGETADQITEIPPATDVTITTGEFSNLTFRFQDDEVTVTAFERSN